MKLHRFYIEENLGEGKEIMVTHRDRLNQWKNVFRFTSGDRVILFNGDGFESEAEFLEIHKEKAVLMVGDKKPVWVPEKKVNLYLALIKKDLFELVCEKATELGVSEIIPIITERALGKNLNIERLEKIIIEASEQCGRGDVPKLQDIVSLDVALTDCKGEIFVGDMNGESIQNIKSETKDRSIIIGPEGGWSPKELEMFSKKNIKTFSLGPTTLRAETAAIVAVHSFIR